MFIEYFRKHTFDPAGVELAPTCIFYKHLMPPASFDIHEMHGLSNGKKDSIFPKRWNPYPSTLLP